MKTASRESAFSVIEMIAVLVVVAAFALIIRPSVAGMSDRESLVATLNNARQLEICSQMMALDSVQTGTGIIWTTVREDGKPRPVTAVEYFRALTKNGYTTEKDLKKMLTAPGKGPGAEEPTAANSCFKFFWVQESSPANQPLLVTANWTPKGLDAKAQPYGDTACIVFNKGGSGGIVTRSSKDSTRIYDESFPTDATKGYSTTVLE